jgi:transposase
MILNGLGFVERRLYLYPDFFEGIAVKRLLGPELHRGPYLAPVQTIHPFTIEWQ